MEFFCRWRTVSIMVIFGALSFSTSSQENLTKCDRINQDRSSLRLSVDQQDKMPQNAQKSVLKTSVFCVNLTVTVHFHLVAGADFISNTTRAQNGPHFLQPAEVLFNSRWRILVRILLQKIGKDFVIFP